MFVCVCCCFWLLALGRSVGPSTVLPWESASSSRLCSESHLGGHFPGCIPGRTSDPWLLTLVPGRVPTRKGRQSEALHTPSSSLSKQSCGPQTGRPWGPEEAALTAAGQVHPAGSGSPFCWSHFDSEKLAICTSTVLALRLPLNPALTTDPNVSWCPSVPAGASSQAAGKGPHNRQVALVCVPRTGRGGHAPVIPEPLSGRFLLRLLQTAAWLGSR